MYIAALGASTGASGGATAGLDDGEAHFHGSLETQGVGAEGATEASPMTLDVDSSAGVMGSLAPEIWATMSRSAKKHWHKRLNKEEFGKATGSFGKAV